MPAQLQSLPVELLSNIGRGLSAQDCLNLSVSCRSLHAACIDALLLKTIIDTQHTLFNFHASNIDRIARRVNEDARVLAKYSYFALDLGRLGHWDKEALSAVIRRHFDLDIDIWRRYSLADLRASQLCGYLNAQVEAGPSSVQASKTSAILAQAVRYLPQLLLLKHPSAHASGLAPALMSEIMSRPEPSTATSARVDAGQKPPAPIANDVDSRIAFSFAAAMLSQDSPEVTLSRTKDPKAALDGFLLNTCSQISSKMRNSASSSGPESVLTQADAQVIVGSFSASLRRAFREYRVRRLIGHQYYSFILPFALDIPLPEEMVSASLKLPIPFRDDWETWQQSYVQSMAASSFLQAGTWVGCYSCNDYLKPEIDAPMRDIKFRISSGTGTADGHASLWADATDSIGSFTLAGSLSPSGFMRMAKRYVNGPEWEWVCRVTPFGIGGIWGPPGSGVVRGVVWLWKEEWTSQRT